MKFHMLCFALSDADVEQWLSTALPNQLSAGNLGACAAAGQGRYRLYTSERAASRITAAPIIARLKALIEIDIVTLPGIGIVATAGAAESDLIRCQANAVAAAEDDNAAMLPLPVNALWSDGSFRRALERGAAGAAAVLVLGLQVVRESISPAFRDRFLDPTSGVATAAARDLVDLGLEHLHDLARSVFSDAPNFPDLAPHVIWRADNRGMAVKSFRVVPLLIQPKFPGTLVRQPIDREYWRKACPDATRHHVVQDSDEIAKLVLEPQQNHYTTLQPSGLKLANMTQMARGPHFDDFERSLFLDHTFRLHADDPGTALVAAEKQAKAFGDRLKFAMNA